VPQQQINIEIPLDQLKVRKCECGSEAFVPACKLVEVPAIYSPTGKAGIIVAEAGFFCCANCGKSMTTEVKEPVEEKKLVVVGDKG
jgi:hypothetical protein